MSALRVLLLPETVTDKNGRKSRLWVAIGLDAWHAAQGATKAKAITAIGHVTITQFVIDILHRITPFTQIAPAPKEYHQAWHAAKRKTGTKRQNIKVKVCWGSKDSPINPTVGYTFEIATAKEKA